MDVSRVRGRCPRCGAACFWGKSMDKKYQVFVSSTYEDLKEERNAVIQTLLECDCIPVGMELFPAADDDQWTFIKRIIEECDYYIVIVGGKYGSCDQEGMSYTEKEYRHASGRVPIAGFVHGDPGTIRADRSEGDAGKKRKLEEFKALVAKKMMRKWTNPDDLAGAVSLTMAKMKKLYPREGWVRASAAASEGSARELLKARKEVERLQKLVDEQTVSGIEIDELCQGSDQFALEYTAETYSSEDLIGDEDDVKWFRGSVRWVWDDIFAAIAPRMRSRLSTEEVEQEIQEALLNRESTKIEKSPGYKTRITVSVSVSSTYVDTILIQLSALKLVKRMPTKSGDDSWTLTRLGELHMYQLRALRRS